MLQGLIDKALGHLRHPDELEYFFLIPPTSLQITVTESQNLLTNYKEPSTHVFSTLYK